MHLPGHISVALAQHLVPPLSKEKKALKFILLASILPDVVDKTIGYVLGAMPGGRHIAHNIFSLLGVSLLVGLIWGRFIGFAFGFGYLGHLAADNLMRVPLFFPVRKYKFRQREFYFNWPRFFREAAVLGVTLVIYAILQHKIQKSLVIATKQNPTIIASQVLTQQHPVDSRKS